MRTANGCARFRRNNPAADATRSAAVLHIAARPEVRTNLGVMNPGLEPVTVKFTLMGIDGQAFQFKDVHDSTIGPLIADADLGLPGEGLRASGVRQLHVGVASVEVGTGTELDRTLRFRVHAVLLADATSEAVIYDTLVDPVSGGLVIMGGGKAVSG